MSTGTSPEKSIHGQNEYYLHKFLVEDDAKIKIWLTTEHLPSPITVILDTSWAKTSHSVSLEGTTGRCTLERDAKKQLVLAIYLEGWELDFRSCTDLNFTNKEERLVAQTPLGSM